MTKAPRVRITSYIRNVGRSFGYAVGDVAGEYAPTMKSIVDDSKQLHEDFKMSSGDMKNSIREMINEYKTGVVANTLDDLKTGNWYNKKREEDALNDMFGGSFDFDDDWGDFDDNFDDDNDISDSSDDTRDTRAIINSIDSVGENISKNVAYSNARSAEYIVSNQKASTRAMYELTGKGFSQVSNILLNMSDTMVGLASIGEPLSQHIQNSGVFYTQTTESLNKINESLTKLVERTAYMDQMNKQSNGKKNSFGDIISGGEFSLSSYFDMVKENTKDQLEMFTTIKDMIEMMGGKGGKNASLASLLPQYLVKKALPNFFKATITQFNETINNALINTMVRGRKATEKSDNFFLNLIGDILFPKLNRKTSVDAGKYKKGPMQWDGEAKQALTRVIPDYLAKIYGALTGEQKYYDYDKGTYKTLSEVNNEREEYFKEQARYAGRDFKEAALKRTSETHKLNVEKELDDLIYNSIMNKDFDFQDLVRVLHFSKNYRQIAQKLGISIATANALRELYADSNKAFSTDRTVFSNLERNAYVAQNNIANRMQSEEDKGNSLLGLLGSADFHGKKIVISGGSGGNGQSITIEQVNVKDYDKKQVNYKAEKIEGKEAYSIGGRTFEISKKEADEIERELDKLSTDAEKEKFLKTKAGEQLAKTAKGTLKSIFTSNKEVGEKDTPKTPRQKLLAGIKHFWEKPFYAVSLAMDNLSRGINDLFWGPNGDDGIIAKISNKLKDTWGKLKEKIKEFLTKDNESMKDAMKREWGSIKESFKEGFTKKISDKYDALKTARQKFNEQYLASEAERDKFGEEITSAMGSGLIPLAGGASEIIGKDEKGYDIAKEGNKFFRLIRDKVSGEIKKKVELKLNYDKDKAGRDQRWRNDRNAKSIDTAYLSGMKDSLVHNKATNTIDKGARILGSGILEAAHRIIYGDKDMEEQKKTIMSNLSKTMQDLAPAKGAIGIGAIGGAGVSLLTGALVGPIAGAAIGAGIGLASKSQAFQNFLFGEGDPTSDKYKEGLLGGFGKALKADGFKSAKKTGIGMIAGGAVGTALGSPIVGAIIGSAAGYVASSEKAKNFLFGDTDNKKALGVIKDKIKERFPNMTAGMIAGLVAGPFTLPGNLVVGAALGYVSASEKFKTFMFGEEEKDENGKGTGKRKGGLVGTIHDKIVNPLDEIMHNTANMIKGSLKNIFKKVSDVFSKLAMGLGRRLNGFIERHPILKEFTNKVKSALSKFNPLKLIPMALNGLRNASAKHNIRKGYGVYDAKLGRNLYAEELQAKAEELGMFGPSATNTTNAAKLIAAAQSPEELDEIISAANDINNRKIDREREYFSAIESDDLTRKLKDAGLNPRQIKEYRDALYNAKKRGGKIDDFTARFDDATKEKLNNISFDVEQSLNKSDEDFAESNALMKKLKAAGIKLDGGIGSLNAGTFAEMAKNEKKRFENEEKTADNTTKTNENVDDIKKSVANIVEILERLDRNNSGIFSSEEGGSSGLFRRLAGGASGDKKRTEFDAAGNPHQFVENNQGEWVEDTTDKETKKSRESMNKITKSLESLPLIGSAIAGFGKLGKLFETNDEEGGKKKKGFFESLADFLDPDSSNSGWAKMANFLSSGKSWLKVAGGNIAGFAGLASIGLAVAGLSGQMNNFANKVVKAVDKDDNATSHGRLNSGSKTATLADGTKTELQVDPVTGKAVTDENGNYLDYQGNPISPNDVESISSTENRSLSKNLWKNMGLQTARNLGKGKTGAKAIGGVAAGMIRGGKNLIKKSASTSGTKLNKLVRGAKTEARQIKRVGKNLGKAGKKIANSKLGTKIGSVLESIGTVLKKVLKKFKITAAADKIDDLVTSIASKLSSKLSSIGGKAVAGFTDAIPVIGQVLYIADLVVTATNAWGDAENILGIIEEATTGQKIVATLIATINEAIPMVGGLIPHDIMASIIIGAMEMIPCPLWSDDIAHLREQQAEAKQVVDQYNSENGTDYTIEEYNLNVNENVKSGWWTSTKHKAKSAWDTLWNKKKQTSTEEAAEGSGLIHKLPSHRLSSAFKRGTHFKPTMMSGGASGVATGKIDNPVNNIFNKVTENFNSDSILSAAGLDKQTMMSFSDQISKLSKAAEEGDLKTIGKSALKITGNLKASPMLSFFKMGYDMAKSFNSMGGIFGNIVKPIGEVTDEITDGSTSMLDKVKNIASDTWDKVKNAAKSFWSGLFGSDDSSTSSDAAGGASGFVSQFDPRYQGYQVSGSNFAGKGCGPAVASMAASALGKNLPVGSAVSASRGYQVGNGVTLDYFANALGSQGIDTEYIAGGGAGDLYSSIASGKKVILLGQDRANTSKAYSPFGPNNHYVVATGLDRSGNVVVNDPELNGPTTYSPGILNSVKYGVAAGRSGLRRSRLPRRLRYLAGGGNPRNDATTQSIWAYLTQNLGMSEAAAAGIMGNMEAESGCQPDRHQVKGSAYGLCQWDGGRKTKLMQMPNYQSLGTQLAYLQSELTNSSITFWKKSTTVTDYKTHKTFQAPSMTYGEFKALTDVATATIKFEAAFERAGKPNIEDRIKWAKAYYEMFSGKTYEVPSDISTATLAATTQTEDTTGTTTQTEETQDENAGLFKNIFSYVSDFGTLFSNAFNKAFSKEDTSSTSNTSTTTDTTSTDNTTYSTTAGSVSTMGPAIGSTITQIKGGKAQPYPQGNRNAQSVVDIARSQLGVTEEGDNITDYGKFTGADGKPWCASFASWVFDKAFNGDKTARNKALRGGTSAAVQTFYDNFRKANALSSTPQPGDLVIYKNGTSHVGIVEDVQGNKVYTIEGNTSGNSGFDRNGGVVYRKEFDYTNRKSGKGAKLSGFGRPDWSAAAGGYSGLARMAGGSAGILMNSRAGSRNGLPSVVDPKTGRLIPFSRFAGGATNIADASRNMLNELSTNVSNNKNSNAISPELIAQLLSAITNILNNIADNTAPVNKIYQALVAYLEAGGSSGTDTVNIHKAPQKAAVNQNQSTEIGDDIKALVSTLAELAKG